MSSPMETQTRRSGTAKHINRPRGGSNNQAARGPNRNARSNRGGKVNKSDERSAGGRTDAPNGRQSVEGEVAQQHANTTTDVCWICAEPVKYYALSECNHRTCHVCALRLRALYKKIECTFCKVTFNLRSLCHIVTDISWFIGETRISYIHEVSRCTFRIIQVRRDPVQRCEVIHLFRNSGNNGGLLVIAQVQLSRAAVCLHG